LQTPRDRAERIDQLSSTRSLIDDAMSKPSPAASTSMSRRWSSRLPLSRWLALHRRDKGLSLSVPTRATTTARARRLDYPLIRPLSISTPLDSAGQRIFNLTLPRCPPNGRVGHGRALAADEFYV